MTNHESVFSVTSRVTLQANQTIVSENIVLRNFTGTSFIGKHQQLFRLNHEKLASSICHQIEQFSQFASSFCKRLLILPQNVYPYLGVVIRVNLMKQVL